jgi:hypothetical protein
MLEVEGQAISGNATWPGIVIVRAWGQLVFACRKRGGVDVVRNPWRKIHKVIVVGKAFRCVISKSNGSCSLGWIIADMERLHGLLACLASIRLD